MKLQSIVRKGKEVREDFMKRKVMIVAVLLALLAGTGALLQSPGSAIDAVTGATSKSKRSAKTASKLEGNYILGINLEKEKFSNKDVRQKLKELIREESLGEDFAKDRLSFTLYVSKEDKALLHYVTKLCDKLEEKGVVVTLKKYSNTMLRSKVMGGSYEAFLVNEDVMDVEKLEQVDDMTMKATEMR